MNVQWKINLNTGVYTHLDEDADQIIFFDEEFPQMKLLPMVTEFTTSKSMYILILLLIGRKGYDSASCIFLKNNALFRTRSC